MRAIAFGKILAFLFLPALGSLFLQASAPEARRTGWAPPEATLHIGYDDNVFYLDDGELGKRSSWVFGLEQRLAYRPFTPVEIGYAPSARFFLNEANESHVRHTVGLSFRDKESPGSPDFRTALTLVDGPAESPRFDAGRHAFSSVALAERRRQLKNESSLALRFAPNAFFLRSRSRLAYTDPDTAERPGVAGFDNYTRRHDARSGLDLGRSIKDDLDLLIGWHHGRQGQGRQGGRITDRSNHYHRFFAGMEGNLLPGLSVRGEAGVAYHDYDDPASAGPSTLARFYADATATVRVTAQDALALSVRRLQGLSATSPLSIELSFLEAAYARRWTDTWSSRLIGQARGSDYDGSVRNDWTYSARAEVSRQWTDQLGSTFAVDRDLGRSRADGDRAGSEFNRLSISTSIDWHF